MYVWFQPENRYHVEIGTKFYRVKLAPLKSEPLVTTACQTVNLCDPQGEKVGPSY